jgi:hypothetical protein
MYTYIREIRQAKLTNARVVELSGDQQHQQEGEGEEEMDAASYLAPGAFWVLRCGSVAFMEC